MASPPLFWAELRSRASRARPPQVGLDRQLEVLRQHGSLPDGVDSRTGHLGMTGQGDTVARPPDRRTVHRTEAEVHLEEAVLTQREI